MSFEKEKTMRAGIIGLGYANVSRQQNKIWQNNKY